MAFPYFINTCSSATTTGYSIMSPTASILYNSYESEYDNNTSYGLYQIESNGIYNKTFKKYNNWSSWGSAASTTTNVQYPYLEVSTTGNNYKWLKCYYGVTNDGWVQYQAPEPSPQEKLRKAIRERLSPAIHIARHPLTKSEEREIRARETLRRMVGADQYQRYLRQGFITIRSKVTGLTYQLYGQGGVKVWKNGQKIESWCVLLTGGVPSTDQLIMRYLLVVNNPEKLRKMANVTNYGQAAQIASNLQPTPSLTKSLSELFRSWKEQKVAV